MRGFLIALQFLTILPLDPSLGPSFKGIGRPTPVGLKDRKVYPLGLEIKSEIKEKDFGRALIYFPVVGALIGLVLALVLLAFDFLPNLAKIALVLVGSIIITGAIHLDGFADTCDGFFSGKSKEKILSIMHDPHIGTMGVIAVVGLLLLKFSLMASISKDILWKSLIMMAVFSRWIQVLACYLSKYAKEFGKARLFIEYASLKEAIISGLITVTLLYVLGNWKVLFLFIPVLFAAFLLIHYIKRRLGGMTGDTIGAVSEIIEVCVLLFSLILFRDTV